MHTAIGLKFLMWLFKNMPIPFSRESALLKGILVYMLLGGYSKCEQRHELVSDFGTGVETKDSYS